MQNFAKVQNPKPLAIKISISVSVSGPLFWKVSVIRISTKFYIGATLLSILRVGMLVNHYLIRNLEMYVLEIVVIFYPSLLAQHQEHNGRQFTVKIDK